MKKLETKTPSPTPQPAPSPRPGPAADTRNRGRSPEYHVPDHAKTHGNPSKITETHENKKRAPAPPSYKKSRTDIKRKDCFEENQNHFNPNPSPLAALAEDQRLQLIAWIESGEPLASIAERVGQEPPEGFAVKTYPTSLRRFYARHRAAAQRDNLDLAFSLPDSAPHHPLLDRVTATAVRHIAFELAHAPCSGAKHFKSLSRWILRLRDQEHQNKLLDLARSRLAFEIEKFRTDVAELVLKNHEKIAGVKREILSDHEVSERARLLVVDRLKEMLIQHNRDYPEQEAMLAKFQAEGIIKTNTKPLPDS